jgi:hypothetical protein
MMLIIIILPGRVNAISPTLHWSTHDADKLGMLRCYCACSSVTGLKVYAYELPTHLAFDMERFVGFQGGTAAHRS